MLSMQSRQIANFLTLTSSIVALGLALSAAGCERDASARLAEPTREQGAAPSAPPPAPNATGAKEAVNGRDADKAPITVNAPAKLRDTSFRAATSVEGLRVKRLVVTREVVAREPVQVDRLVTNEPVVAFVELANNGAEEGRIAITFEYPGKNPVGHIELPVKAEQSRWRTWGRTHLVTEAGRWQAVVRSLDGTELARQEFEVVGP
jgi:hypothetical protein